MIYDPKHDSNFHDTTYEYFRRKLKEIPRPYRVMEAGTRRSRPDHATHAKDRVFPDASHYVMVDLLPGIDVDVVADLHNLTKSFPENSFDVFWANAVWEHLERPWIATKEVLKILRPGGIFYVQTHQTFCLHAYPSDYYRFSRQAIETLFRDAGASELVSGYRFPCAIQSDICPDLGEHESYLNVIIAGRK